MSQVNVNTFQDVVVPWLLSHGLRIVGILLAALILRAVARLTIEKVIRKAIKPTEGDTPAAEKKREDTVMQIMISVTGLTIWIIAAIMILGELGIQIGPILAGAGVIGIAFGFGAQYIIRDLLSGVFIIFENQYRVGDVINVGKVGGTVTDITLRLTTLRDLNGTVHHIRNGDIHTVSNEAKDFGKVNIDLGIAYNSDLTKVEQVVNKTGKQLAEDPAWSGKILSPPKYIRVTEFGDSAITIKILGKTRALKQWAVTGEMNKRLKDAFESEGIEIPYPQIVVHQKKD